MGSISGFSCSKCDFNIIIDGVDCFYVDHETDELVEYILLMSTEIDKDNKMSGYIYRTYCSNCDKLIKTYVIIESKYFEEESINILEEIIKKSDINDKNQIEIGFDFEYEEPNEFIKKFMKNENILSVVCFEPFDEYSDDDDINIYIDCPQCGKKLSKIFYTDKCPICDSELEFSLDALLD